MTQPEPLTLLQRFRQERGLSQNQVSIHTGIDRYTLARWEQGTVPRLDLVEKFARRYGLDVNDWRVANGYEAVTMRPSEEEDTSGRQPDEPGQPEQWIDELQGVIVAAFGGHEDEMSENDRQEAIIALAAAAAATREMQKRRRRLS